MSYWWCLNHQRVEGDEGSRTGNDSEAATRCSRKRSAASRCGIHRQHCDDFFHLSRRVHTSLDAGVRSLARLPSTWLPTVLGSDTIRGVYQR